ncbi:MAG: PorT family protein [Chitinophagaceae bacterium]|nr:PorT family protein [Chitinophagaceae bacterium]
MKKIFLFLLFANILQWSFAKQKFGIDLGIGVKGGLNMNKVQGLGWQNQYSTDPHAGFFMHLNKRHAGFQLEAVWSQSHIITDSSFTGLYRQYLQNADDSVNAESFRFSTISIPILLNIKLTQWLWLQAGPQFNAHVSVADKNRIIKSGLDIINKQSYSAVGGIWIQFGGKAPLIRVNLGARYIAGLDNLNSLTNKEIWKSQMVQLHLGISY